MIEDWTILLNIGVVLLTFVAMEGVAWGMHKYVMHGFLWYLHKDHHTKEPGFFEKNDTFFLIFAIPSSLSIIGGIHYGLSYLLSIGAGIALYGIAYFLVHEVLIHRRFNWLDNVRSPYLKRLIKAHRHHHSKRSKEDGRCFGMLIVPSEFKH